MHWLVREVLGRFTRRVTRWWLAGFDRATRRCRETQHRALFEKIRRNSSSTLGRDHHFDQIRSVADFRKHIPITKYDYYSAYLDRVMRGETAAMFGPKSQVLMFAMTSGTTSEPKYVPVTREFLDEYRYGWMLWGISCYDSHPKMYRLKVVHMTSDWEVTRTSGGIPCGAISGLTMRAQKRIVRERYCVPRGLVKVHDINSKYYAVLRYSIGWPVGMATTANPSTLINLAKIGDVEKEALLRDLADGTLSTRFEIPQDVRDDLEKLTKQRLPARVRELERIVSETGHLYPKDYWPDLQVISHWTGGSMGAYLRRCPEYWGNIPSRDIGLVASEGRMTIPAADGTPAGILDILHQYFEFIPEDEIDSENPTVLEANELQEGEKYFILLTTSSGFYRYNIHDLVRCTGFHHETPLVEFLNKGSHFSSITGEKISEFQVSHAVAASLAELHLTLKAFTLVPCWADPPYYSLLVETDDLPNSEIAARLAYCVDRHLSAENVEYENKRTTRRLGPITLKVLAARTWEEFARTRLAERGGTAEQYKHPCLVSDLDFVRRFQPLREIAAAVPGEALKLA